MMGQESYGLGSLFSDDFHGTIFSSWVIDSGQSLLYYVVIITPFFLFFFLCF